MDAPTESFPPLGEDELELFFVGTATVVLRVAGFTILTDPNFLHQGEHAPLGWGLRSRRLTEPAIGLDDLPPLDFIVLSHHHGDHFDPRVVAELPKHTPIVCNHHAARKLGRQGFQVRHPLATWERWSTVKGATTVSVTSLPAKHAPQPLRSLLPPVMGSLLEVARADEARLRIYLSGDTLVHDDLRQIPQRFPEIHLGVLHLGGTRVMGVTLTMTGADGVEALRVIRPRHAVPVHYDDYTVFKSPLDDFRRALAAATDLETETHFVARGGRLRFAIDSLAR